MNRTLLLFIICAISYSCGTNHLPKRDKLREKAEPYDMFSFQRSYPYPDFDWQGWRNVIHQTRASETAQLRGNGGCGSNLTNWINQGPMNVAGRCNTMAVKPDDENTLLAGFSGGGLFKSTDGAVNWHPVFDENPELSIGDIVFAPSQPNLAFAGTGDPNMPSLVFNGNGIYKSQDAGETWQHLPNGPTGIVSKVLVHPLNPDVIWAATMGNPYIRDNQRGVYKSIDGGNSWTHVLFVSNQAGASDLVMSPANPDILYASFWDRIRNNFESVAYGTNAKVYKSTDGGNTWTQLGGGLPTEIMGRTGLAVSQTNPDKVYAVYIDSLHTPGGLFKTTNGGTTWTALNILQLEDACADFGWYFGKVHLNPANDEDLYFHGIHLWRKAINGSGWSIASGGHADSHDLVFTPSGRRYWANDGGVYRNDGQASWTKSKNLPTTQFYRTTYNPHEPDKYFAGAQDNGIQKGNGLNPNGWVQVFPADGFSCAFDPNNPEHYWVEIQNGTIHETNDNGDSWQFGSAALGTNDRTNWDTPFFASTHTANRQYAATYRAYARDQGSGWGAISGDLTDGIILEPRFHTASCMNESPVIPNKLVAGTSDGNVWRREANGNWASISPGLPKRYVTSVHYSPTLANRIFVTHSGFRDNENLPHIHRSDDNGNTWQDISSDLPQVPVNDLFVLPGFADEVLVAATDAGVYYTTNGGGFWSRLGGNMPYIPVFDFAHNPVKKELVAATFARGIWTFPLDSIFVQQQPVNVTLSGIVQDELGEGVEAVAVQNTLTASNGTFSAQNVPGCAAYTLTPYRNDNPLNGLTTYDLVLISKHILGLEPFSSPFKMIAADANHSGSITTFDIVQLRKLILGIDTAFANNTSWRFIPASYVFLNPMNPFQWPVPETLDVQVLAAPVNNLNFIGLKVGDVNNSAIPGYSGVLTERTEHAWPLQVDWAQDGEKWVATITAPKSDICAFQTSLGFNPSLWQLESIQPVWSELTDEHFGLSRIKEGWIGVAHGTASQHANQDGLTLFRLVFQPKQQSFQPPALTLGNRPTLSVAYRTDGVAMLPVFEQELNAEVQVFPNPFGKNGCRIMSRTGGLLEIQDVSGKPIWRKMTQPDEIILLESDIFPNTGVYYWKSGKNSGKLLFFP
ncbi:MAG: hypothetical protein JNN28_20055 [Saprospiraceae bacterium]|nr:hypothetical protein [Saprospiraceae bacterium]